MDTERSESKGTPKQEADLQRHLRHQKGMRSRQESPATSATIRILGVLLRFLGMPGEALFIFTQIEKQFTLGLGRGHFDYAPVLQHILVNLGTNPMDRK